MAVISAGSFTSVTDTFAVGKKLVRGVGYTPPSTTVVVTRKIINGVIYEPGGAAGPVLPTTGQIFPRGFS